MQKIFTATLCLLLVSAFVLSGCGSSAPLKKSSAAGFAKPQYQWSTDGGETLVVWGDETDLDRSYLKKAFERYEALTGNTLLIEPISKQDYEARAASAFDSGNANQPDILLSQGGRNLDRFYPDDNFYDFTDAPWVDDLTSTSINQTIYNGRVIGLPHSEASISGTLYNKKLFKKCGITPPRTQQEFMNACETLLENGITPMYLPYAEITMLLYQFPLDTLLQEDGVLSSLNDGSLSYSQIPEMQTIVEWYRTMSDKGYFGTNYTKNNWGGMDDALKSKDYAMMLCWDTWLYSDYTGNPADFGLMPAFMGVPEEGTFEGPNLTMLIVNKNSPRLEAALNFINFVADPYNYNVAFEGLYTAPVFKKQVKSISTPQYVEAERLIEKHFCDSTAWLRIKGFAQIDASYIQRHMQEKDYSATQCLLDMDAARKKRAAQSLFRG